MKMNLNCETILDIYTYKNRNVLCQIKISPKRGNFKNSCRSLSQEQWSIFDEELEKLIATIDDWSNEKCLEFNIKSNIHVRVQKSKLSVNKFYKCLGANGDFERVRDEDKGKVAEDNFVLECMFDFEMDVPLCSSIVSQDCDITLDSISDSSLPYEPNTPTKKKYITNEININITNSMDLVCDEIINSPNPSSELAQSGPFLSKHLLTNATCSSSDSNESTDNDIIKEAVINSKYENLSRLKEIRRDEKKSIESDLTDKDIVETNAIEDKSNKKLQRVKSFEHCVLREGTQKNALQTDHIRKESKRSKSSDISLESIKDKHLSKKERPKSTETQSQYDITVEKRHLETLDEKSVQKNKDKIYKASQQKIDKDCTLKEKNTKSEKEPSQGMREDDVITISTENPSAESESAIDSSPQKEIRERKLKSSSKEIKISLRRSERSPSKPKRFIDEQSKLLNTKKHRSSHKNKELFGSEDDDDDFFENNNSGNSYNKNKIKSPAFETPVSKKYGPSTSSSSTSTKKKRKRDKSSECQQEKRDMSKWLSKKRILPLSQEEAKSSKNKQKSSSCKPRPLKTSKKTKVQKTDVNSKNQAQSSTPPPTTLEMPSKEEIQLIKNQNKLMQQENAITKAELDKMCPSSPKAVEILSLQTIPVDEILETFSMYKSELDEIYENNYKRDYIKGHDGINHCFVMGLLQQNTLMKMLEKLTEAYEDSNGATQATLFANALLPEWVIRVYMEKFNFTRQKAIEQVKAQEEFQLHMEAQNENSLMFD